jgi:hypothetical protein
MRQISHLFGRAIRESGQALDRLGLRMVESELFHETYSRHRPIMTLYDKVKFCSYLQQIASLPYNFPILYHSDQESGLTPSLLPVQPCAVKCS